MGASLSTAAEAAEEGVTVVSHGAARPGAAADDDTLLRQLAALKHSLPLVPESAESGSSAWTRALQRTPSASSSSSSSPPAPLPRQLDPEPLEQLVTDYQRFSRWHCRRIVEKQEQLNATIPRVEQQAVRLQHRLADAAHAAAAQRAALAAAAAEVQREVESTVKRLARLQQSLGELEDVLDAAELARKGAAELARRDELAEGAGASSGDGSAEGQPGHSNREALDAGGGS